MSTPQDYAKEATAAYNSTPVVDPSFLALLAIHGELRRLADVAEAWGAGAFNYHSREKLGAPAPPDWDLIDGVLSNARSAVIDSRMAAPSRAEIEAALAEVRRARGTP